MAFVTYSDNLFEIGYLAETTWGTGNIASANFKIVKTPRGVFVDPKVVSTDLDHNRATRIQVVEDIYADKLTGPVEIRIPEMIVTKESFADFLYSCMQNKVSEAALTPYQKEFRMHASQPDFTANAGMFLTLAWNTTAIAGKGIIVTSCIVKEMDIEIDKTKDRVGAMVKLRNVVILGKTMLGATGTTFSGTWVAQSTNYYFANAFTFKYNDTTAMSWSKFTLHLDNGAKIQDIDTDGTPKTFYLNPPKMGIVTAHVETWYNTETTSTPVDIEADHLAGTVRWYSIQTGSTGVSGFIKILLNAIIKADSNPKGNTDNLMTVPIDLVCGNNQAGTLYAVQISVADAIDQTP
jgi:hypothetical protein